MDLILVNNAKVPNRLVYGSADRAKLKMRHVFAKTNIVPTNLLLGFYTVLSKLEVTETKVLKFNSPVTN